MTSEPALRELPGYPSGGAITIDQTRLHDRVGVLGVARMLDVLKGLALLLGTDEVANGGT